MVNFFQFVILLGIFLSVVIGIFSMIIGFINVLSQKAKRRYYVGGESDGMICGDSWGDDYNFGADYSFDFGGDCGSDGGDCGS